MSNGGRVYRDVEISGYVSPDVNELEGSAHRLQLRRGLQEVDRRVQVLGETVLSLTYKHIVVDIVASTNGVPARIIKESERECGDGRE